MSEDLIARYQLDISDLKLQVKNLEEQYKKLDESQKKTAKSGEEGFKKTADAAKKTNDVTEAFGKKIEDLGKQIAAAFAVERIIAFGAECVMAFGEAERNALKLKTAVSVNGGLGKDFNALIQQSADLQKSTIFSDDAIQAMQTAALQFGLTSDEVQKLTPIITDFASATGQDLNSALSVVISGVNGATRGLKQYGISVDENASAQDRYNQILEQANQKFAGQAELVANQTTLGSIEKLKNAWGDFTESIGAFIATRTSLTSYLGAFTEIINAGFDISNARIAKFTGEQMPLAAAVVKKFNTGYKKLIDEAGANSTEVTNNIMNDIDKQIGKSTKSIEKLKKDLKDQSGDQMLSTEQSIGLENAMIAQYQKLKSELSDYNTKRTEGELVYAKLSTEKLKELAKNNNVFATKELESRQAASKKAQEENKKTADKQKESLNSLIQFTQDAESKIVEINAKSNLDKINNDKKTALEKAKALFIAAGGEANADAVRQYNEAVLAINQEYDALIQKAKIDSAQQTYNELTKISQENSSEDLKNTLTIIDNNANAEINKLKENYIKKGDFSKKAEDKLNKDVAKIKLDAEKLSLEQTKKFDDERIKNTLASDLKLAKDKLDASGGTAEAEAQYATDVANANAKANDDRYKSDVDYAKKKLELEGKTADGVISIQSKGSGNWITDNEQKIKAYQQAADEIINTYNAILEGQVKSKEESLKNLQDSYDAEDEELKKRYDQRLIGAAEFEKQQSELKNRRVADEKKIQEEIKKLKQKEDIANRARSIFDVIINTAVAVAKLLDTPPLAIAAGIAGAAQLATILATPLPKYAKGTKWLERGNNPFGVDTIPIMADEGERIISRDKNKKYWSIYEAIDDNKFDSLINKKYVIPALKKQMKDFNDANSLSLANNISNSLMINHNELAYKFGSEIEWRMRKGIKVQGMNEMIEEISKQIDPRKI